MNQLLTWFMLILVACTESINRFLEFIRFTYSGKYSLLLLAWIWIRNVLRLVSMMKPLVDGKKKFTRSNHCFIISVDSFGRLLRFRDLLRYSP